MEVFQELLCSCCSNGLLIVNPLLFRQAILAANTTNAVVLWSAILILIAALSALFKYWMRVGFISISRDAEQEIRSLLFQRIQQQSMAFYHRHGTGELLSRLTNDISAYRDVLGPGIMYPLFVLTIVGPGLLALFYISKQMAIIALTPLLLIPWVNETVRKKIFVLAVKVQETLGTMSNVVQENFSAARIVKSYVIESAMLRKFSNISQKFSHISVQLAFWQGSLFPFFTFISKITTLLLVVYAGIIILKEWKELSAADFVSFMWIQSYIFYPLLSFAWLIPVYERGRAAYKRLFDIYNEPIEVIDLPGAGRTIPKGAMIEFKDLTFGYPRATKLALNKINLKIEGGSFVGITGPVGAGKSTLFRLLNREYEIPRGMMLIDGHDIHEYPLSEFQQQIVTVDQLPFLFSKSIAENVKFGRNDASQQELELVSRYADFHETVLEFPEQYETLVGERGVILSGGQKQRLAMARAFLVDRSVMLLDDIFSAVDFATEQKIFKAMLEAFRGKTALLITHRVSVLNKMDRVVYMKEGMVVEEGPPRELEKRGGAYAALVELQRLVSHDL